MAGIMESYRHLKKELDGVSAGNGSKIIVQLFCTYFFYTKALADVLVTSSFTIYFQKVLGVEASETNLMQVVAMSPWGLKTLWGTISDCFPILGYNKRYYILGGVCIAVACVACLISFTPTGNTKAEIAALLFMGFYLGGAMVDSLTQARYTELMKLTGCASIVSLVWGLMQISGFLSAPLNMLLPSDDSVASPHQYKILLYLAICFAAPAIYPAAMNYLQEKRGPVTCRPDFKKVKEHKGLFALAMTMAAGVIIGNGVMLVKKDSPQLQMAYFIAVSVTIIVMSYLVLPREIANPTLYMFLCSLMRLTYSAPMQYWYTAGPECIPNGPAFSAKYYQTVSGIAGLFTGSFAVYLFDRYMLSWNVRRAFWITTVAQVISVALELTIIERWNQRLLGSTEPWVDQAFFIVGAQSLESLIYMLDFMPSNVLIGKLCPKNVEATMFAILAGMSNFGTNVSRVAASLALPALGVKLGSEGCSNPQLYLGITGLGWAKIIGAGLLPALTIPITWLLLPNCRLNEDILDDGKESEKQGLDIQKVEYGSTCSTEEDLESVDSRSQSSNDSFQKV